MFTCRDGKSGELSSQASKMLYKPPVAVDIASYKEPLDQSDCRKLFVQLWNYTNRRYSVRFRRIIVNCQHITEVDELSYSDISILFLSVKRAIVLDV